MLAALLSPSVFAASYQWSSGNYNGSGLPLTLSSGDTLEIIGGGDHWASGLLITNQGTIDQLSGLLRLDGSTLDNGGLYLAHDGQDIAQWNTGTFDNSGVLQKASGPGSVGISSAFVNEATGVVQVDAGEIDFNGPSTFHDGTQLKGAGINRINGSSTFDGTINSENLVLSSGNNGVSGSNATFTGVVVHESGHLNGAFTIASGASLELNGGGDHWLDNTSLVNQGTLDHNAGRLLLNASTLSNQATYNTTDGQEIAQWNTGTFDNSGLLHKAAGVGVTVVSSGFVNEATGIVQVDAGEIDFNGPSTFHDGTQLKGAGINRINGSSTFDGTISSENLVLSSGNNGVSGSNATFTGVVVHESGHLNGAFTIASGASLELNGGGDHWLDNTSLVNQGTLDHNAGRLLLNASTLSNQATYNATDSQEIAQWNAGTFDNSGLLHKAAGVGVTVISSNFVNEAAGVVRVDAGEIQYNGSSAFHGGTQLKGAGVNRVNGQTSFDGTVTSENLVLSSSNNGIVGANATLAGKVSYESGHMVGSFTVASGATLAIDGGSDHWLDNASLINHGTIDQNAGRIFVNASTLDNQGTFNAKDGQEVAQWNAGTFDNNGLLLKGAGGGTFTISSGFNNNPGGTIEVDHGTVNIAHDFANTGTLGIGISGQGQNGVLSITGNATFGGTLKLYDLTGYQMQVNDIFTVALFSGTGTGSFALDGSAYAGDTFGIIYDPHAVRVQVLAVAAVPIPGAVWLMGSALSGLFARGARRRKDRGGSAC